MTNSKKKMFVCQSTRYVTFFEIFCEYFYFAAEVNIKESKLMFAQTELQNHFTHGFKIKTVCIKAFLSLHFTLLFLELSVTWLVLDNFQVLSSCKKQDHFLLLKFTNDGDINNK